MSSQDLKIAEYLKREDEEKRVNRDWHVAIAILLVVAVGIIGYAMMTTPAPTNTEVEVVEISVNRSTETPFKDTRPRAGAAQFF